jgi:uncharacterized protein (TIGR02996 family)
MNQEQAFLRAICENPDDDAVRLIFADWLEENGKPERAEFIRRQIETADLPEWDRRWQELRHGELWLSGSGFRQLPSLPEGLSWQWESIRRGFLEGVQATSISTFLEHAERIVAAAPVRSLELRQRYGSFTDITALAESPWLGRLQRLDLSWFPRDFPAGQIERLCDSPHIGSLRSLAFDFGQFTRDDLATLFESDVFPRLTNLSFSNCNQDEDFAGMFVDALPCISGQPQLTALTLGACEVTGRVVEALAASALAARLSSLDLSETSLRADDFRALAGSRRFSRLQVLRLPFNEPGETGVRALVESPYLTDVRWLDLRSTRIGPPAARLLAQSVNLKHLAILELYDNPLGDQGAIALAASPYLTDLVNVDFMTCEIGDAGARALLAWPALANVVKLELADNPFSDSMKAALDQRFGDRLL